MEFAIGTIISIIALAVAYITYRAQVAPATKRLHYAGLSFDLIMPVVHDELREIIKIYLRGHELINPVVCVASIENTGKAPILREDFDGPLVIQSVEKDAIFRGGTLDSDPPNIFDYDHPKRLAFEVKGNKFMVGPVLLNPSDKFQLMYIADMVPDKWDVNVGCRIAGVEKVSRISPAKDVTGMSHDLYIERLSDLPGAAQISPPSDNTLTLNIWVSRILAGIGGRLEEDLDLMVDDRIIEDPHIFYVVIQNGRDTAARHDASSSVTINLPGVRFSRSVAIYVDSSQRELDVTELVTVITRDTLRVKVPTLEPGEVIRVYAVTSGFNMKPVVKYINFDVDDALVFQFRTEDLIEKNLAKFQPVNLLANQKMASIKRGLANLRERITSELASTRQ